MRGESLLLLYESLSLSPSVSLSLSLSLIRSRLVVMRRPATTAAAVTDIVSALPYVILHGLPKWFEPLASVPSGDSPTACRLFLS